MTSKRIRKAAMAGLALSLLMALAARADSAENSHVAVSCEEPRVAVIVEGNQFDVLAPGYPDSFVADVMVGAVNGWVLIKPKASALPLKMKGGDTAGYEVERDPEDEASGTISFHNYHIKSDHDGGAKDIVVPSGASVTYTAYRNGAARKSDWSVNGQIKNDTSSIIFNRNWWNVPAWFIPSMDTPVAGAYGITAKDVDTPELTDSGSMKVVGVHSITGAGKTSKKENAGDLGDAETIVKNKGGSVSLTATPEPNVTWPSEAPTWSASCGFWCILGDHFEGDTAGQSTVSVDTSSPDVIVVTAKCGTSQKCIMVIAYELDLAISKDALTLKHDCETRFTVTAEPSSVIPTPTVQVIRDDIGINTWPDWMDLLSGRGKINWKARVAGKFKLRVKAQIAGEEHLSGEKGMTVEFPIFSQIVVDSTVKSGMHSEWQETLNDCTEIPNLRRERGFWVFLDTSDNDTYSCGSSIQGLWSGPLSGASIILGTRPLPNLSDIAPNALGAKDVVSSFHTHTPTTYKGGRLGGPSPADQTCDQNDNVAGIVFDYTVQNIPAGYPKDSPAKESMSWNKRDISRE